MKTSPKILSGFEATLLTAGLCLALALPSYARDRRNGTVGGQLEPNGTEFTHTESGDFIKVDASVDADWWVTPNIGIDFTPVVEGDEGAEMAVHIKEPLGANDSFWITTSYEYPIPPEADVFISGTDFTLGTRSLAGAEVWIGINYWDEAENGLIPELGNAIISGDGTIPDWEQGFNLDLRSGDLSDYGPQNTPTGLDGFIASDIPNGIDLWRKFTIGESSPAEDWRIKFEDADSYMLNWVMGIVLPSTFPDSNVSGDVITEGLANNLADDILLTWGARELRNPDTLALTDPGSLFAGNPPINPDYNAFSFDIVAVPEPSSTALLGLGGLALMFRRRR